MSELDLSNEVFDPSSWENLDEGQIKDELSGLIKRINNVSALLEKMVADSDYDNTEKYFTRLITEDLSMSGFVRLFYTNNKTIFGGTAICLLSRRSTLTNVTATSWMPFTW